MMRLRWLLVMMLAGWGVVSAHAQERGEPSRSTVTIDTTETAAIPMRSGATEGGLQRVRRRIAEIRGGAGTGSVVGPIVVLMSAEQTPRAPTPSTESVPPTARPDPSSEPSDVATRADLSRMEVRILRRIETLIDEVYRQRGGEAPPPNVFVPPAPSEQPAAPQAPVELQPDAPPSPRAESLRTVPAESLAISVEAPALPEIEPPTVIEVRRAFLDAGLFRALEVNFETGSAALRPRAARSITAIGEVLAQYPSLRVEIGGHTDATGPDDVNQPLSERRAEAVRQYLIDTFDLAPDRLETRGHGPSQPIASNETPSGRALNRRVEFRVLNPEAAERALEGSATDTSASAEAWEDAIREAIQEELQTPADTSERP